MDDADRTTQPLEEMRPLEESAGGVRIVPAGLEQKGLLDNLLELYCHDFSEFIDLPIGAEGRFGYPSLNAYWTSPDHYPFLIEAEGRIAGFALVRRTLQMEPTWDMTEFFILRGERRNGTGIAAALLAFSRFPGPWRVRVMDANPVACRFWARAVQAFAGTQINPVHRTDERGAWTIYRFTSPDGT